MSVVKRVKTRWLIATLALLMLGTVFMTPQNESDVMASGKEKPAKEKPGGPSGDGLIICAFPSTTEAEYAVRYANGPTTTGFSAPIEETFFLHSNPSSNQKLYIDFNGHVGPQYTYTPFDMDGDPSTFNAEESQVIQDTWFYVSEDFLPFNIDVTTEEPPGGWLGQRACIDGSSQFEYSFAYFGDWASLADRECYVYPGDNTWEWIGHSVSHEVGHTVNLQHQGSNADGAYYKGHGTGETQWCPIMGWGADALTNWSDNQYYDSTLGQDDMATIVQVSGLNYRTDDHGNTIGSATPMTLTATQSLIADGIIERTNDVDFFAFSTTGGNVQFSINEDAIIGITNLDVLAQIHNAAGAVIHTSNPEQLVAATFNVMLAVGDYYLSIDGVGWGNPLANPPLGYSDYGIVGYYSILASADVTPAGIADEVSQSSFETYHLAVENSGLGLYDPTKDQGFRNRSFDTGSMTGSLGNQEARQYLVDQFTAMGLTVSVQGAYKNVVAELTGTTRPNDVYIYGAHYDHLSGDRPGGDDNASGTAALLEAARVLSAHQYEATIRFVAFNAEENGLLGSADYVANISGSDTIIGMINMDMILRPGSDEAPSRTIDFEVETNGWLPWTNAFIQAAVDYVPSITVGDLINAGDSFSDNDSFSAAGIPSLLVIENSDGDWYPPNPVANTYYHGFDDASDRLANDPGSPSGVTYDFPFATDVVRIGVSFLDQEAVRDDGFTGDPVPNVVDTAQAAAESTITTAGFVVGTVSTSYSNSIAAGNVISQNPSAGTNALPGASVDIVVSLGVLMVSVPDVVGATQASAEASITAALLTVGNVTTEYNASIAAGLVISQSPSGGTSVASETAVDILVSLGSEPAVNIVLPANGGVLQSFTTEYGQGWVASDLTNGVTNEDGWATTANPSGPQEFVFTFDNGDDKVVFDATIHGGTGEGQYYSKDVQVWLSADGTNYTLAGSGTLANSSNDSVNINLGSAVAKSVKLVVVNGHRTDYWELSEFIVMGTSVPAGDPVPDVVGSAQATAEASITGAGFTVGTVSNSFSDSVVAGNVISQSPAGGASAAPGSSVDIEVSLGVQMVTVPDVTGLAQATAEANITAAQLVVGTVSTSYSNTVATGDVISQSPSAGSSVAHDTNVDIEVSLGVQPVTVPDVVGSAQAAAEASITSASLAVGTVSTSYSDTVANGDVISQSPTGGASVAPGTSVDIEVSLGVEMVTVPDVVDAPQATAEASITASNLSVGIVTTAYSNTVAIGNVISQSPSAGSSVVHDSAVNIEVSLGFQPVNVPNVVGSAQAAAEASITGATLAVGTVSASYSDTVAAGDVISQNPAGGSSVQPGTSVDIEVSLGVQMVTVPDVTGQTQATAEANIIAAALTVGTVSTSYHASVPAGLVISQSPSAGSSVVHDTAVDILVSLGVQPVSVPNVVGSAQATAEASITGASLAVGTVSTSYSDSVATGNVISQSPAGGSSVAPGTSVDIEVSLGVQMVTVPDVVGSTQAAAEASITSAILTVGSVTTEYSETVASGDVISQSPSAGSSVVHDTAVDLVVSLGVENPQVPENVVLPANGGVLQSFTSEYGGGWVATDLTNGVTNEDGWATPANPSGPQEFVYSFLNGTDKIVSEATIHGGTGEGQYYSKDVEVWLSTDGTNYTLAASGTLANSSNDSITLDLGGAIAKRVKLVVVNGHRTDFWELSEFIVMGVAAAPPVQTTVPSVVGLAEATAQSAIAAANLVASSSSAYSETVAAGLVISQSIAGGTTVDEYTTVGIVVSSGPAPSGDTITIIKAEWKPDRSELKVEATSSDNGNVTLTVTGYGTMNWKADKNKYEYKKKPVAAPGSTVTVTSSGGGSAVKTVTIK